MVEILSRAPDCLLKLVIPPPEPPPSRPAPSVWSLFAVAKTPAEEEEEEVSRRMFGPPEKGGRGPRGRGRGGRGGRRGSIFPGARAGTGLAAAAGAEVLGPAEIAQRAADYVAG